MKKYCSLAALVVALLGLIGSAAASSSWQDVLAAQCAPSGLHPRDCDVVIPAGQEVELTGDAEAASVTVRGALRWGAGRPSVLSAGFVVAEGPGGLIEVGTSEVPAPEGSGVYLVDNGRSHGALGKRSFGSFQPGGSFHVHGRRLGRTWMLLSRPAYHGQTSLALDSDASSAGWRVGDRIVVAPTTSYPKFAHDSSAEEFTITRIDGADVSIDRPIHQDRAGFPSRRVQAEVINLSRTVTITGDPFDGNRHGLHCVAHSGGVGVVNYARITRGGQYKVPGKYPLHFHLAGECKSCQFVGNAIEDSSQRGIIVHGSHRTLVSENVLYDVMGSYLYVEDGNEMENKIQYNVAICPIKNGCKIADTDNVQADDHQQSGLWALSVSNDFVGNRLVNHYNGFFTQTSAFPHGRGKAAGRVCTMYAPFGRIQGNVCHSNERFGFYLDNNFPRKLARSVETNGMLSEEDFWHHIDGNPHTFSSCDAFTASGEDNGVSSVVEDQLEIGNSFSGQYALGDVQFLRWHAINNLHGIYWKETKAMASPGVTAHIKDSTFEWISSWDHSEIRRILGSPEAGVAAIAGPGGLGAFIIEGTTFKGHLGTAIAANQHCGLTGTGGLCTPEYLLKDIRWEVNPSTKRIKFGFSDGNSVLPIFTSFDDSLMSYASVASSAQTHLLGLPGCAMTNDPALDEGIGCSLPLRRLQIWSSHGNQGAVLVAPGGQRWPMEFIGPPTNNNRKQAFGAAVAPGHRYVVELANDDAITVEFSDTIFAGEEIALELRFRDNPAANRVCVVSSQHSRAFINSDGPLFDDGSLGACTVHGGDASPPGGSPTIAGCMDASADNFNPDANQDDDSCFYTILGCMDASADNFNPDANQDDDSCTYPPAEGGRIAFTEDFSSSSLGPWYVYVNQYNTAGNWVGWYGNWPAPVHGPQMSMLVNAETGDQALSFWSNYDDPASASLLIETNIYRGFTLSAEEVGSYTASFTARAPETLQCGSTNPNNGASGGTCSAFVKVIHSSTYELLLFESVDTTSASQDGERFSFDFTITSPLVGHIYQIGFMNTATQYAPTGLMYDDIKVEAAGGGDASSPPSGGSPTILGCMDASADNFNPDANQDDDSCFYTVLGCMDASADNFNPDANEDDDSCFYTVLGCMDASADNFNPDANEDDDSCFYTILGCMDASADNFNPDANQDDDSCFYTILGCMDASADNFNPDANQDDDSCFYTILGCMDASADNFNPDANQDDDSCFYTILGCMDASADNFNPDANQDDDSCTYPPAEGGRIAFTEDFSSSSLGPWYVYVNQYNTAGNWVGWYGNWPAPVHGPQMSMLVNAETGDQALSFWSNYDDPASASLLIETNIYRGFTLSAEEVGSYTASFTARAPETLQCGSTNPNNGASGGTCSAFVKVIHSSTYELLLFESVDTTSASQDGERFSFDFTITSPLVGHIYQIGFMNTATQYAPTGLMYDDIKVEAAGGGDASSPPPPAEEQDYPPTTADMKCDGTTAQERDVASACDDRLFATSPNPFTGEGYYTIDMRCLTGSLVGCVGASGCRLCHTEPDGYAGHSSYAKCPSCVCEKFGMDREACLPTA
ncbi:G8 domain-containing protein [Chloropicon primus]|nr:G8 domain-containing protein [Chloropicon primus]